MPSRNLERKKQKVLSTECCVLSDHQTLLKQQPLSKQYSAFSTQYCQLALSCAELDREAHAEFARGQVLGHVRKHDAPGNLECLVVERRLAAALSQDDPADVAAGGELHFDLGLACPV